MVLRIVWNSLEWLSLIFSYSLFTYCCYRYSWYHRVSSQFLYRSFSNKVPFKSFSYHPSQYHSRSAHLYTSEHNPHNLWYSNTHTYWILTLEWLRTWMAVIFQAHWWLTLRSFQLGKDLCSKSKVSGGHPWGWPSVEGSKVDKGWCSFCRSRFRNVSGKQHLLKLLECHGLDFILAVTFWHKCVDICVRLQHKPQFQSGWWVLRLNKKSHKRWVFKLDKAQVSSWLLPKCFPFSIPMMHHSKWSEESCTNDLSSKWLPSFSSYHSQWEVCRSRMDQTEWTRTDIWDSQQLTWTDRTYDRRWLRSFSWGKSPMLIWPLQNQAFHHDLSFKCTVCL